MSENLDRLIYDFKDFLEKKYLEILYLYSNNLTKSYHLYVEEVKKNWDNFLKKNNIIFAFETEPGAQSELEQKLIDLINKKQINLKDKFIFKISLKGPESKQELIRECYLLSSVEDARKLIVLDSFKNKN